MESTRRFTSSMAARLQSPTRRHFHTATSTTYRVAQPVLRVLGAIVSRFANRQFIFTIGAVSLVAAKLVHIYAYLTALTPKDIFGWGLSFFTQDTALILLIRLLFDQQTLGAVRWLSFASAGLASLLVLFNLVLAAISISFFAVAGSELHWRNAALAGDSSSWKLLLTGLFSCTVVVFIVLVISWLAQDVVYFLAGIALNLIKWPFTFVLNRFPSRQRRPLNVKYEHVPQLDLEGASELSPKEEDDMASSVGESPRASKLLTGTYIFVGIALALQCALSLARPVESSLTFMSWTLPLLPFIDFARSSPSLANLLPVYGTGITLDWDNRTALVEPISWPWLPKETELAGFEDWYEKGAKHYRASDDPLKISNLDSDLLPQLRDAMSNTSIRHVVLIKLESTRKDVFPFKKDSFIWDKLTNTFENKSLSEDARSRLETLTPTANFLTGDYDDGFEHEEKPRRGGINANQVHTTATYTLKSLTGTLCGLSPVVADFNAEVSHHIYQPCLPHILEAMNLHRDQDKEAAEDDFTSYPWKNWFMQSVTNGFDKQDQLMLKWGFPLNNTIYKEYLKSEDAKFGMVDLEDVNYYGMPEVAIEDYVRDAFQQAKENDERVFLTHLTSTAHHPFGIPENETVVHLAAEGKLEDLSKYLNAVGYVDRWLQKVLDILEEEGVADETLVVLVGDHGLSVAENDGITPYYNSNIGNFHVPLVVSHPSLPAIDIDDPVISFQILPTILDLLVETGSLDSAQAQIAKDLVQNYEGQSLIRPLVDTNEKTHQPNWQFTVMNPGRATIAVRDARPNKWRLTAPIIENTEWRFTDLDLDPHEKDPVVAFSFKQFLKKVEKERGLDAAKWTEEAAFMARWWVEENSHRWRYDPTK